MSATTPTVTTQETAQREPTAQPEVVKPAVTDKYRLTVLLVTLSVLAFVMITTVTGQWVKPEFAAYDDNAIQYDLWGTCNCMDADVALNCSKNENLFRATAGFSVIGVGSQFIAIVTFILIWTRATTTRPRLVGLFFAWLAVIALILSWTIFAGNFNQKYCGAKLKFLGDLHWAFGLRVGESILWLIVAILFTLHNSRPVERQRNFLRVALFLAVFVFIISIATTTGRGWVIEDDHGVNRQFSVWEACNCTKTKHFKCFEERRLFRAQEAFAVISVGTTALLFWFVLFSLPRVLHVILAFLSFASILITWVVFSQWFAEGHCGQPKPSTFFQYYWPFGLNVCAFIIQVINFVITLVGACRLF
jgi:hypothetical protein